jgi:hypothetical protein
MPDPNDNPLTREHPRPAGTVEPWPAVKQTWEPIAGDEKLVKDSWEELDAWSYAFVWHCLVSF